jgi:hypothetical protein
MMTIDQDGRTDEDYATVGKHVANLLWCAIMFGMISPIMIYLFPL